MRIDTSMAMTTPVSPAPTSPPRPLSLQGLELEPETPADTYHSGNSAYTCIARSGFSMGC